LSRAPRLHSYFVRHTDGMSIGDDAIDDLWDKNKIAIHYPEHERFSEDLTSLDPEQYHGEGRTAVEVLREMNEQGGYVWAQYRPTKRFPSLRLKIGKIAPHSFEVYVTKWNDRDRIARLKTLQIVEARALIPIQAPNLQVARPPFLTISRWDAVRNGLADLVERRPLSRTWRSLGDEEQNIVCAEYLRNPDAAQVPTLKHLLYPVGGKMPDIDIFGYATDGKLLYAYVTFSRRENLQEHIERLRASYVGHSSHVVVFCDCDAIQESDAILFIPTKHVEQWLANDSEYENHMFESGR
jgi:hypothetical protein